MILQQESHSHQLFLIFASMVMTQFWILTIALVACDPPATVTHSSVIPDLSKYDYDTSLNLIYGSGDLCSPQQQSHIHHLLQILASMIMTQSGILSIAVVTCDPPATASHSSLTPYCSQYDYDTLWNLIYCSGDLSQYDYNTSLNLIYSSHDLWSPSNSHTFISYSWS